MGNRYLVRVPKKDKTGLSWREGMSEFQKNFFKLAEKKKILPRPPKLLTILQRT
jgi:hypothetical protein